MINDIKQGLKLMRYGYGWKSLIGVGIFIFALGIIYLSCGLFLPVHGDFLAMGSYLFFVAAMMPFQLLYTLNVSKLALSSPMRKKLQTRIPSVIFDISMLALYSFFILYSFAAILMHPAWADEFYRGIVFTVLFAGILIIYVAVCCKYMIVSSVFFIALYMLSHRMYMDDIGIKDFSFLNNVSPVLGVAALGALGAVGIIAFGFVGYLLSLLVYKKPVSKYSQNVYLRKEM